MPRGVPNKKWNDPKIVKKFMKLCDKAQKPSVDWVKFRELDKDGTFLEFDIHSLSSHFRKIRLMEGGLCWQCGKNRPAKDEGGLCMECRTYFREHNNKGSYPV